MTTSVWKTIGLIAITALITCVGTAWGIRTKQDERAEQMISAINARPTKKEVERIVEKEAPYTEDRSFILEALKQATEERAELRAHVRELTKSTAALTAALERRSR